MKKKLLIIAIISIFLITISTINTYAATWYFTWSNTYVKIPVGSSLYDYSSVPRATLYRDDQALTDARITYAREGDWLYYLKDVNTSKVGVYKVWYKAGEYDKYKPGTCTGYKALITFEVYDDTPPTLKITNSILNIEKSSIAQENLDSYLKDNVKASDNYSNDIDITLYHSINVNTIGIYDVVVSATDINSNISFQEFKVNIFYDNYPSLSCVNSDNMIYVNVNTNVDIKECFKAYDRLDGDLTSEIRYSPLDTSSVSSYPITVSVTNSSGLTKEIEVIVNVVDNVSPTLTLKYESINLDYKTDLETFDFSYYLDIVDDNVINYDNLTYQTNICNKVGVYDVTFNYTDGYNSVSKSLSVRMLSYEAPKIIVDDITIKKNSNIDLRDYITVYDESDPYAKETLVLDESGIDYTTDGTYYVTASCNNSSGMYQEKRFIVVIESDGINSSNIGLIIALVSIIAIIVLSLITVFIVIIIKKHKQINTKSKL